MMNKKFFLSFLSVILLAGQVLALDLQTAKTQKLVGERTTGYIGAVVNRADVTSLVNSVNIQRKQAYLAISRENGQPVNLVEALAAKKLYAKLQKGEYYEAADGSWKMK